MKSYRHSELFVLSVIAGLVLGRIGGIFDVLLGNPHGYTLFGVELHHYHYGLVLMVVFFIAYFACAMEKAWVLMFAGFGMGLYLDEARLAFVETALPPSLVPSYYFYETFPDFFCFLLVLLFLYIIVRTRKKGG